jgi:hypothetical protein
MKTRILILLIAFSVLTITGTAFATNLSTKPDTEQAKQKAAKPQCQALTKKGTQCKHKAAEGSKYCKMHSAYDPSAAPAPKAKKAHKKPAADESSDDKTDESSSD